jgi:hypothetical protein
MHAPAQKRLGNRTKAGGPFSFHVPPEMRSGAEDAGVVLGNDMTPKVAPNGAVHQIAGLQPSIPPTLEQ